MYTLLNKKRFGIASYLAAFFMIMFLPVVMAIKQVGEGGGGEGETPEQKALFLEIEKRINTIVENQTKENVKKSDVDKDLKEINKMITELSDKQIKELSETVANQAKTITDLTNASKEQGIELAKMKNKPEAPVKMSFREAVKESIMEYKDKILTNVSDTYGERLSMKGYFTGGNRQSPTFTIKAAVDMLQSNISGNYVNNIRLTELDPMRVSVPVAIYAHVLEGIFPSKQLNKPFMSFLVVGTYWDGSGTKTEGSASGKSSFLLTTVEFKAFNVSTHFILSDETLDDIEEALDEIAIVAPDKIHESIDSKVFADSGDNSTDIRGLLVGGTTCTDFVAATYADTVKGANIIDLISKAKLSIEKSKYRPNMVVMNGTDIESFQGLKDALDNSVLDRRVAWGPMGVPVAVCGMRIVQNDSLTANTMLVLDNTKVMLGVRKAMTMEIGLNSTDFTEGQKTVRIGMRLAVGVRDKAALSYVTAIGNDIDTINKATA
jgi:uncharacterized coiled-coil protein SlyX